MALGNTWLALSCLLALSHSGRHERMYYCINSAALCRAIEGCSLALAVRKTLVAFGASFVPAWCAHKRSRFKKKKKAKNFGKVLFPTNNFIGNYGLRRVERWDDTPSMPSEVGEI